MTTAGRFRFHLVVLLIVCWAPSCVAAEAAAKDEVLVTKIWDRARHNAFTDLIRWHDRFYCTFRESNRHVFGDDGKIRLITSQDGRTWKSVALIAQPGIDLRDPKLSITPDDRLMILMGGSYYDGKELKPPPAPRQLFATGRSQTHQIRPDRRGQKHRHRQRLAVACGLA